MLTRVGVPVASEAEPSAAGPEPTTLICFSHLRWNFVFQRPQHLMSRFAQEMDVIFWEEPVEMGPRETAYLQVREAQDAANVRVVVPHLPQGMPEDAREAALARLLEAHLANVRGALIAWYYTPMMLPFSKHITPDLTVYDAMDELSKFKFAPEHLLSFEQELIDRSDIVFTGGSSLYEAKKDRHDNVHCFPSSVDRVHFLKARARQFEEPGAAGAGIVYQALLAFGADAEPVFADGLRSQNEHVRVASVFGLGSLLEPSAAAAQVEHMLGDESPLVRASTAHMLERVGGGAVPAGLVRATQDEHRGVRRAAVSALASYDDPQSLQLALSALDDPDRDAAIRAGETLVRLSSLPRVGGDARRVVETTDAWPLERARVLASLGTV